MMQQVSKDRLSRDEMLMAVAHVVAERGTCSRLSVGAVMAKEGRILVTGYNGAARGLSHCSHESYSFHKDMGPVPEWAERALKGGSRPDWGNLFFDGSTISSAPGCTIAQHAERNAIDFAAREGIRLEGADLYVTHAPCEACARSLLGVGIKSIYFWEKYRKTEGVQLLVREGIEVVDMQNSPR